jgi:hypothetical protein
MQTAAEYLTWLQEKGVNLWVDDGQLRYRASKGLLSPEELARLRSFKEGIIAALSATRQVPLSFQQRWLMKLMRQHPGWVGSLAYAFRVNGAIQHDLLERSLEAVLLRHGALRTRIVATADVATQYVAEPDGYPLDTLTIAEACDADIQDLAQRHLIELIARQSDFSAGPLNARLLKIADDDCALLLVIHRLIADCISVGQVLKEIWQDYADRLQGQHESLAAEYSQYQDYVLWQQSTQNEWEQKHAAYWQTRLTDAQCIHWPATDSDADLAEDAFCCQTLSFGEALSADLHALSRQGKTLPAIVMLTIYAFLVSRWCHQRDFIVPFNLMGRHSDHENVVGYFSHVLYLRILLNGSETFLDLLRATANAFYRAVFHQDFGRMATERPEFLQGALFQWLSWHPHAVPGVEPGELANLLGCSVESMRVQDASALTTVPPGAVGMELSFFETPDGVSAMAHFPTSVFTKTDMQRFLEELRTHCEYFIRYPQLRLADVRLA